MSDKYSVRQREYIDSVDGRCHASAVAIIGELEAEVGVAVAERVQIVQNHRELMAMAAEECGMEFFGDDTPHHMADRIRELEAGLRAVADLVPEFYRDELEALLKEEIENE